MAYEKIKGIAYYLGAASTFATFIGIEAYNHARYGHANLEDNVNALIFGIPMISLLPMGIYCIGKSVSYLRKDKQDKE